MRSVEDMKRDLFGDTSMHTIYSKEEDPYATLEGSGWELVPALDTPKEKPMDLKAFLEMLKAKPTEKDIQYMSERLEHFRMKATANRIDMTCLDIAEAPQDLDDLLYYYRGESMWAEYKHMYDLGLELIDSLGYILSRNPDLPLDDIIRRLMNTMDEYKDIREADECLL